MRPVLVDIQNLALKGFRCQDRLAIAAALQDELMRLLAQPEVAERLARIGGGPRAKIGEVNLGANPKPHQVGAKTARAIGKGLLK